MSEETHEGSGKGPSKPVSKMDLGKVIRSRLTEAIGKVSQHIFPKNDSADRLAYRITEAALYLRSLRVASNVFHVLGVIR